MSQDIVIILDVAIHNISLKDLLSKLNHYGGVVFTPNVDHLIKIQKDPEMRRVYESADYCVCDSKIIQYASYFLGQPIQEKVSGSDLFPAFYQHNKDNENVRIFLLGAEKGVAEQAQININNKAGRTIVVDTYSPPLGFENDPVECQKIIDKIRQSGATVLAIGLGAPKQEKWIARYKSALPDIKVFFAIGATIDFEAGYKSRSPKWMSEAGLEWLHRLLLEPQRLWKRYLIDDLPFLVLILKQKLGLPPYSKPKVSISNKTEL